MMKILFVGYKDSVFIKNLAEELRRRNIYVDIFDPHQLLFFDGTENKTIKYNLFHKVLNRVPGISGLFKLILINRIFKRFEKKYDICNIHFNLRRYSFIANSIKNIGGKLVVTIYGSDFYRNSNISRKIQSKIYKLANIISFANKQMKKDFLDFYGHFYERKITMLRYGLKPLEYIDKLNKESIEDSKKVLGMPDNSLVTACGYNANPEQNHRGIIESILNVKNKLPDNLFFVFPMTYGNKKREIEIEKALDKTNYEFKIFNRFMLDLDVARLRRVSDIMINVQPTDQLSGSMLEHLYAGSIVIAGSWLPYGVLYDRGAFILKVDSIGEIGNKVIEALNNFEDYKKQARRNQSIVDEIGRWERNINQWIKVYKELSGE